ncbi:hypothetical protein ElyMa_005716300 [Elysia marginata]|uniref:Uncharacterized protein n=1 Tax=Elysia marginata TaxID=1093978 RepID=A0AAV4FHU0_9GAST|nr:hypothetical protein ElyMa_005716300 [Elysia marginata]
MDVYDCIWTLGPQKEPVSSSARKVSIVTTPLIVTTVREGLPKALGWAHLGKAHWGNSQIHESKVRQDSLETGGFRKKLNES